MGSAGAPDPRTPVLIGVGQLSNRVDRGEPVLEPVELMIRAARLAGEDAGVPDALRAVDAVRVISTLSWRYRDPGALVAQHLGASPADTAYTVVGGNYVQTVVNQTALDIAASRADLVLVTGGEAWRTRSAARKAGGSPEWTLQGEDVPEARPIGVNHPLSHDLEVQRGIFLPIQMYPLMDISLRHALGLSVEEHRARICGLWSRFSDVAAKNPNAWIQRSYTTDELLATGVDNRMVCWPYPKLLNSNNNVEQGAALLLCSVERAEALGVPRDRWVFLHSGADATDHWFVSERWELHESPAMRLAGGGALELAGFEAGALDHVDLYSCFPAAVQMAARELGLDIERPLTVTGGMSFAGGPWNNYAMHAVATMADVLRSEPGTIGLTTANGGYTTKHAFGVWSTDPPAAGVFRHHDAQADVDALPRRTVDGDHVGPVAIEAYTVVHDRDGAAEKALLALRTPSDGRTWGSSGEPELLVALEAGDLVGTAASIDADGVVTVTANLT